MSFKDNGFEVVRRAVDPEVLDLLTNQILQYKDWVYTATKTDKSNLYSFADDTNKSFTINSNVHAIANGAFMLDGLLQMLHKKIEQVTGTELYPTYACGRIYYPGATMFKHKDRPSCEYSVSLCVARDGDAWPLWVESRDKKNIPLYFKPGDMVVYKGTELSHWRDAYTEGTRLIQVFLHYVSINGPYKEYKYDKRSGLGLTQEK